MNINVSLDQLKRAITIREQIGSLENELAEVLRGNGSVIPRKGTWKMSAYARARIGAAQKAIRKPSATTESDRTFVDRLTITTNQITESTPISTVEKVGVW